MKNFKNKFSPKSNNLEEFYIKNSYLLIKSPETEKQAKEILTLPVNQELSPKEIKYIPEQIKKFYNS
tara:strand:- start:750 stop:950 length:201 start_codon:yes stop_codon:yes gene_type:complete